MHLPPDIYPPTQDSWKKVSDIIIQAAADQGNTLLIRNGGTRRKPNKKTREFRYDLLCQRAKCFQPLKEQERSMSTLNVNNDNNCYFTNEYKHGIRQDPVCGQSRIGIRGTAKNEGKSDSRRTETTRVKSTDGLCKFKISLRLLPGKHWRITNCHKSKGFHNHIQLEKRELSVGSNVLSSMEKRICVSLESTVVVELRITCFSILLTTR